MELYFAQCGECGSYKVYSHWDENRERYFECGECGKIYKPEKPKVVAKKRRKQNYGNMDVFILLGVAACVLLPPIVCFVLGWIAR